MRLSARPTASGSWTAGSTWVYSRRFGWTLQDRLREVLEREHDGELPVGQAVIIETFDRTIPFLISAPTMRVPMDVSDTVNAYLAFRAAIRVAQGHNKSQERKIDSVLCPGLGTAVGRMRPEVCARQMHYAYGTCHLGQPWRFLALGNAVDVQWRMVEWDVWAIAAGPGRA